MEPITADRSVGDEVERPTLVQTIRAAPSAVTKWPTASCVASLKEHIHSIREAVREGGQLERRLADAGRKVDDLADAIAAGDSAFKEVDAALANAKAEASDVRQQLASLDALPTIALHPGLAQQYRNAIEQLHEELADPETRKEAAPRLRKLIARIVVTPSAGKRGVELEVIRHIDEVLALAEAQRA